MNVLPLEKQLQIANCLVEGTSLRATARMCDVERNTVGRVLVRIGERCASLLNEKMRRIRSRRVEVDEIWTFVFKKQARITSKDDESLMGDQYVFTAMDAETHEAPREMVHHNQHPVGTQQRRFASKQIDAPQTVLRVPQDREPGWPRRVRLRRVPNGENASHHILVQGNTEGQGDLLRDSWTTPRRIPLFHVDDGGDDLPTGALRARLPPHRG